ncbi:hypothetical protein H257_09985 [Aphanomyces astaci]|uniref:Uncharacterized protein n=1 Tax=Aphanomyces astaci TaxID=112090 RepID=W4G8H1_APHAT|nr:hypothetical protein H257_09985 [Aphanomyces astaci]ETV75556.1 hypothetical protein H257_09985 [Aphanomyces astaci]|eukprot:XP_009834687.1 hypothetical protein H257_09985 [Aphanomyces astaci]
MITSVEREGHFASCQFVVISVQPSHRRAPTSKRYAVNMVGFGKKKSVGLISDTELERKGKVDGSSLLDDNGDPTHGTLYEGENFDKKVRRADNQNEEDEPKKPASRSWFRIPGLSSKKK